MDKKRLLQFFVETKTEYRVDELHMLINPKIDRDKLELYCIEFLEKGWIERDEARTNAYGITDKGIMRYSFSWSSRLNDSQRITIIGITISAILVLIGFYLQYSCS